MEVLQATCFGVSANADEFDALASQVVKEQEQYREARIAARTGD